MTKLHPLEGDVKEAIKRMLTKHGWFFFMPPANAFGRTGISDIIAIKYGIMFAIEVKLDKAEGSPPQEAFMEKVRDHGGRAMLVNRKKLAEFEAVLIGIDADWP